MAKLTLTFKDKVIRAYRLETDVPAHIGQAESNEIRIDSLAVAPTHAVVVCNKKGETIIKQLNDEFPLTVNDLPGREHQLNEGDRISIGKHVLQYSDAATPKELSQNSQLQPNWLNQEIKLSVKVPEANLQILNGKHIGRLIPLKRALTRLGKTGSGIVVIAKRKGGYFLSPLEGEQAIKVNSQSLGQETIRLSHGDTLEIDETAMQFFVEQ
jgi:FHA domain